MCYCLQSCTLVCSQCSFNITYLKQNITVFTACKTQCLCRKCIRAFKWWGNSSVYPHFYHLLPSPIAVPSKMLSAPLLPSLVLSLLLQRLSEIISHWFLWLMLQLIVWIMFRHCKWGRNILSAHQLWNG